MKLTFNFDKDTSPIFGDIFRPIAQVFFYSDVKKRWYSSLMVVDTGADYTVLPKYFAYKLGIDLNKECKVYSMSGVGGIEKVYLLKSIRAKIGKWEKTIPLGFVNSNNIPPLMGRHMFLETFETLFSSDHTVSFSIK